MKKKYLIYSIVPVLALAALGISATTWAHGWFGGFGMADNNATPEQFAQQQQTQFQNIASLLGISVDEVKSAWAEGKTIQQIAQDHNISNEQLKQKMIENRNQQMSEYLKTLVSQGVITQAQADQRLQFINQHMQNLQNGKKNGLGFGFGHMRF